MAETLEDCIAEVEDCLKRNLGFSNDRTAWILRAYKTLREARADDLECAYCEGFRDGDGEAIGIDKGWEHSATKALLEQDNG